MNIIRKIILAALIPIAMCSSLPIRVLVVTGGHAYDKPRFDAMFSGFHGMQVTYRELASGVEIFEDVSDWKYDVLVLYNKHNPGEALTEKHKRNFLALLDKGVGLLCLHHATNAYPTWPEYAKIIGVTYRSPAYFTTNLSTFTFPGPVTMKVEDTQDPIMQGIPPAFQLDDEIYGNVAFETGNKILLSTSHPSTNGPLSWTRKYRNAKVFTTLLGHGPGSFDNPGFSRMLGQAILEIAPCQGYACMEGTQGATVQFEMGGLLNARPVTTVSNGKLVPWVESLDGTGSGEATMAAGKLMGDALPKALPDDGRFPANDRHPEVLLHFSNSDATGKQVHRSLAADTFSLPAVPGNYSHLSVFCMSGNGPSSLNIKLIYQDGMEIRNVVVPDWYTQIAGSDTTRYNLAQDLAKWNQANQKMESDHHYLYGLSLSPNRARILTRMEVIKTKPGVLTFWGATGSLQPRATTVRSRSLGGGESVHSASLYGTTRNLLGRTLPAAVGEPIVRPK